ncbi:MAG: hypothetical protein CUN51_05675 [Candidatus Thermofonsia Clade 1 bacterium]|uniref:Glycosyltransferase RgtA/B/C/D-like domain-containing protein n=1 Tax=Candidatus Thermofonsia Clade 1 bacterium TaxID=2364210 RepID=A0A2M8P096_9CHLR|nr:MAG: hypothetical protein CUN51_05675 [Candidatus Thermofonsia Clade 1 bacterium]
MTMEALNLEKTQTTAESPPERHTQRGGFQLALSLEAIFYIVIVLFAAIIRLPELDLIPLKSAEATEALAAWHAINPNAVGEAPLSVQPLGFGVNALLMSIGGLENAIARMGTLLAGMAVIFMPLAFRRWLGAAQTVIAMALLAISPALLVASRSISGTVWALFTALLAAWAFARFAETRRERYVIIAAGAAALTVLGTEPAGALMLLMLIVGALFALWTLNDAESGLQNAWRDLREALPLTKMGIAAAVALIAGSTALFTIPNGLAHVGATLEAGLRGIFIGTADAPFMFPFLTSLVYEPLFWLFGLVGAYFVLTANPEETPLAEQFIGRALIGWLIAAVVASLVYAGGIADHALWLTLPLAGLSTFAIVRALAPVQDRYWHVPTWAPYLHGVILVATLLIAGVNLLWVGRVTLSMMPELFPPLQQQDLMRALMIVLALALSVITFFLVGSIWGSRAAWHGTGIGLVMLLGVYSFNAGWQAAVSKFDDPRELWHVNPSSRNLNLLVQTLETASLRATGKPTMAEIVVERAAVENNAPLRWALQRFPNHRYVDILSSAVNAPIAIGVAPEPALGADYVGQRLATQSIWFLSTLQYWDFVNWLYDRQARLAPQPSGHVIIWVRADIYGVAEAESSRR